MRKFHENRRFYLLVATVAIVMVVGFCTNARAYTYESYFNPNQFNNYTPVETEQVGGNLFIVSIISKDMSPMFVVNLIRIVNQRILLSAYAYLDKDFNLMHFVSIKGHYTKLEPSEEAKTLILFKLQRMEALYGT